MIMSAASSLTNRPAEHQAGPRLPAGWEAPPSAPGLEQRQARLWEADAAPRSAPGQACWRVGWREQIRPGLRGQSASNAMTWAIRSACMQKVIVSRFPARFSTVRPLLIPPHRRHHPHLLYPLRRAAGRKLCLRAYRRLPQAFRRRPRRARLSAKRSSIRPATCREFALMRL
jgi:hypothetical protein